MQSWTDGIGELVKNSLIAAFAIDEAHCISEWGHDFRSSYRQLNCLREQFPTVPIVAVTATATSRVSAEVISHLGLRDPLIVRTSFDRPNLFYECRISGDLASDLTTDLIISPCIIYCPSKVFEKLELKKKKKNSFSIIVTSIVACFLSWFVVLAFLIAFLFDAIMFYNHVISILDLV